MTVEERVAVQDRIDDLTRIARRLWREEPAARGPERTKILLELHTVRFDLEDLGRRLGAGRRCADDERLLDACSVRLDQLTPLWP